jgi:hypothetical protein
LKYICNLQIIYNLEGIPPWTPFLPILVNLEFYGFALAISSFVVWLLIALVMCEGGMEWSLG